MREIKFRAWDGDEFRYLDYAKEDIHRCGSFEDIQQYTGLKDKNGKEIYEGDIVTVDITEDNISYGKYGVEKQYTCIVDWNEYVWGWEFYPQGRHNGIAKDGIDWEKGWDSERELGQEDSRHTVEVIGNIYENKELLDEQS